MPQLMVKGTLRHFGEKTKGRLSNKTREHLDYFTQYFGLDTILQNISYFSSFESDFSRADWLLREFSLAIRCRANCHTGFSLISLVYTQ